MNLLQSGLVLTLMCSVFLGIGHVTKQRAIPSYTITTTKITVVKRSVKHIFIPVTGGGVVLLQPTIIIRNDNGENVELFIEEKNARPFVRWKEKDIFLDEH